MKNTTYFLITLFLLFSYHTMAQTKTVAHRGAFKNTGAPENSLESLRHAFEMLAEGSEFDINMTLDGILVVNHDNDYFGKVIEQHNYAELNQTQLSNGENLPLLEDFFRLSKKHKKTILFAEIKPSPSGAKKSREVAGAVYKMAKKHKALKRTIFISFSYDALLELLETDKNVHVQYLGGDKSPAELNADHITGLDYHFSVFQKNPEWIADAKKLGMSTNAWTVNSTKTMEWLTDHGIDYITTNEPETSIELFKKKVVRKLIWADEFNYTGLPDSTKWAYDTGSSGWGNNELQDYLNANPKNVMVENGVLTITARKEGEHITSTRLVTRGKKDFLYGKIEVRAKLPAGRGSWPAIWMLGTNISEVGWPESGEIDIMEHVGFDPGIIWGSIHTQKFNHLNGTQKNNSIKIENFNTDFHTYAVDWSKEKIDFLIDDQVYLSIPNEYQTLQEWPFSAPQYLLLNLAIGGNWGGQQGVDENIFPSKFIIDYVRYYE